MYQLAMIMAPLVIKTSLIESLAILTWGRISYPFEISDEILTILKAAIK